MTEVLIAMGILTVGLLGVASVFPVASYYMQKGDVADRASAIAQAAFNELVSNGMLNPERWLMLQPTTTPSPDRRWTYSKRFTQSLRDEIAAQSTNTDIRLRNRILNAKYASVYAIDPIGVNSSPINAADPLDRRQVYLGQKLPTDAYPAGFWNYWQPWNPAGVPNLAPADVSWPVMRVTFEQSPGTFSPWPMERTIAERLFTATDDLSLDMPPQADRPSVQRWDTYDLNNDGRPDPLTRQSRGDYSWIATVAPANTKARDAIATSPASYEYEVSVAVFYKRVLDNAGELDSARGERSLRGRIVSTGLSGGEMFVEQISGTSKEPFVGLKVGNWVPVCGPHPNSTEQEPMFVFRWYRVLSIDDEAPGIINNSATQRLVSLRGPQWPWQPATILTTNDLPNNVCLAIIPNVVAVHSKTVRLEGKSAWSMQ